MAKYAQFGADGIVTAIVESSSNLASATCKEVADYSFLGKKWDGAKFVDAEKVGRYKVWGKAEFVVQCGQAVLDAILDSSNKELRYFKYVLDSAPFVDLNVPDYFNMVKRLNDLKILPDATYAILIAKV